MLRTSIYRERTTLRAIIAGLIVATAGIGLMFLAYSVPWFRQHLYTQSVLVSLGGLLVASIAGTIVWELISKRAFQHEVLSLAGVADDVIAARLVKITTDFREGIDWAESMSRAVEVDFYFSYARTWRQHHHVALSQLAARRGVHVRLVLPDPQATHVVDELGRRYATTPIDIQARIREAHTEFVKMFSIANGATLGVWYLPQNPVFSLYRFDNIAVIALYPHRQGRMAVPTIVVEKGGSMYDFITAEFEAMVNDQAGLAKRVHPDRQ